MMTKIILDAGHGGSDTGAVGNGLRESDIALSVTQKVGNILKSSGVDVIYTRTTDTKVELSTRYTQANNEKADYFISIHANAGGGSGTETLIYKLGNKAEPLARKIQSAIVEKLYTKNRGIKERPDLAVLKHTTMPAILIELAFVDNVNDAYLLKHKQTEFAQAIADAILSYLGISTQTNRYSNDETVHNLISDGITTVENKTYWENALNDKIPIKASYVRALLDRYHEKLNK